MREGEREYGVMVIHSQQHVASCVKMVEYGFSMRGFENVSRYLAFWTGNPVEVTQETGIVPHL